MAYQSVHSGPAIDAAVTQLADIQIVRDESNANLATVQNLAAQVATDAGTASTAAASATQTLNDATAAIAAADHTRQEQIDAEIAIVADQRFAAEQAATEAVAAADAAVVTVTQDMAASVPTPNKLPLADAQGKIASDWLGADIARAADVVVVPTRASIAARQSADGGVFMAAGLCYIASQGAVAIADLPGWLPHGDIYPDHFAENAEPGVTDMSAAVKSAIDYAQIIAGTGYIGRNASSVVRFAPTDYYIGQKVQWPSSYSNITLDGGGARLVTDIDGAMLQAGEDALFDQSTPSNTFATSYRLTVKNFIFFHKNGSALQPVALAAAKSVGAVIENNWFVNFWISLDGVAFGDAVVNNNRFQLDFARTLASHCHFRLRAAPGAAGASPRNSYGVQFNGNEVLGAGQEFLNKLGHGIVIHSCDGFVFSNNHISFYGGNALRIEPLNDGINTFVTSIVSSGGNYFDDPAPGAQQVAIVGRVQYYGDNDPRNCLLQNIRFCNDYFRGDGKADYGINLYVADDGGYAAKYGGVQGLVISNSFFRTHRGTAIGLAGADAGRLPAYRPIISGNRFDSGRAGASSAGRSYLSVDAKGWMISGNVMLAESGSTASSVFLDSRGFGAVSGVFANNDMGDVLASSPVEIRADSTARLSSGPNVLPLGVAPTGDMRAICVTSGNSISLVNSAQLNSYVVGMRIRFRATEANTGPATLSLNGGVAQACSTVTGVALPAGYLRTDRDTVAEWTGASWRLTRDDEILTGSGYRAIRSADGTQTLQMTNIVPNWTSTSTQPINFPVVFSETPAGGLTGIRSGADVAVSNFQTIRAHGPAGPTQFFLRLTGAGVNGSGAEYTLTALFSGKWY